MPACCIRCLELPTGTITKVARVPSIASVVVPHGVAPAARLREKRGGPIHDVRPAGTSLLSEGVVANYGGNSGTGSVDSTASPNGVRNRFKRGPTNGDLPLESVPDTVRMSDAIELTHIPEFSRWGAGRGPLRPTTGDSTDLSDPTARQTSKKRGKLGVRRGLRSPFACQIWRKPRNLFVTAVLESGAPCLSPHLLPVRHADAPRHAVTRRYAVTDGQTLESSRFRFFNLVVRRYRADRG